MSLRNRLIFNVKWHRRIGLFCVFFVFLLSITGLLLNHTTNLKLDSIKLRSTLISSLYNLPSVKTVSFQTEAQWVSHDGINTLYLGMQEIQQCAAPLKGAAIHGSLLHVLCENELLILTAQGELLERITPVLGLPADSQALTLIDGQLVIKTPNGGLSVDIDNLQFEAATATTRWPSAQTPPTQLAKFLENRGPAMSLEQVVLDLHSGRLFRKFGVLLMDFVAILLIILSITGFIAWRTSHKMRRPGQTRSLR